MFLTLLAMAAGATTATSAPSFPQLSFSRHPALARTSEEVCLKGVGKRGAYLLRRISTDGDGKRTETWADTIRCPAALPRLQALETLTMPQVDLPGFGADFAFVTMDGAGYRLSAPALYGGATSNVVVSSNVETPLARWIDGTLKALAPCWRDRE